MLLPCVSGVYWADVELCGVVCRVSQRVLGFESLLLCSSINKCCCSVCIYKDSPQFISFPFWHGCSSCKVCSGLPYSCWLLRICIAYADRGLLVFMYLMCSLCRTVKTCQFDQYRNFYMFCIVTCKFHWLLVYCWRTGIKGIWELCYLFWMRYVNWCFWKGWWLYVWGGYDTWILSIFYLLFVRGCCMYVVF